MRKSLLVVLFLSFGFGSFAQKKAYLVKSRPPMFLIGTLDAPDSKFGDFKRPDFAGAFNSVGISMCLIMVPPFSLWEGLFPSLTC